MQYKNAAIIVAGLMAQQAVSFGGSWNDKDPYSCPANTNNQCSSSQSGGYDWSGLQSGSFSSYGSNTFSGFSCSNSFGKRDVLTKRQFQSKCISANLDDSPSMSCDEGSNFSINEMQVSSSQDVDVECHYGMPDGTTCTEYHSCSSGGSVLQNSQCGGAKSVTFKPAANAPPSCSIGVHSIGFNCGSPSSTAVSTAPATSSVPAQSYSTVPSSSAAPSSSAPVGSSTAPCYGASCSSTSSAPVASSTAPCYGSSCSSSSAPVSSSAPACSGSDCSSSSAPASSYAPPSYGSSSSSSAAPVSSNAPPSYGSSSSSSSAAPASSYAPPSYGSSSSSSAVPASSYVPPSWGSKSSAPAVSSYPASSSSSASPTSPPSPSCPDLLPRCLKTWLFMTSCTDSSDYSCFCGDEAYITKVFGCVSAWGTASDTQAAASYLMGICAPYIPNNPAIITACPSTVTPTASATETDKCTTITYSSPVVVPATYSTGVSAGYSIPASSYTTNLITTVTVPQVQFTTSTITVAGTTTCSVGLGSGPPSSVPAYTTAPAATTTGGALICNEYEDGQPQCSSGSAVAATTAPATTVPAAAPSYGSTAAAAGTSFGTSWASPSASYTGVVPSTGGGAKIGSGLSGLALGVIAALAAL